MSSKKKQGTDKVEKKKFPLFNLGKSKDSPGPNVGKNATEVSDTAAADTGVIAAVQHSTETPSSSNNGKMTKFGKFFKRGAPKATIKKTSKKADEKAISQQPQKASEGTPAGAAKQNPKFAGEKSQGAENTVDKLAATPIGVDGDLQLEKAATKVQAVFKGRTQRRRYLQERQSKMEVEAQARGYLARKQSDGMESAQEITNDDAKTNDAEKESAQLNADKTESVDLITFT